MKLNHAPNILGSLLIATSYGMTIYLMCKLSGTESTRLAFSDAIEIFTLNLLGHTVIIAFRANQLRKFGLISTPTLSSKIVWRERYWLPQSSIAYVITGYGLNDASGRQIYKTMLSTAAQVISIKAAAYMTFLAVACLLILFGETKLSGVGLIARLTSEGDCVIFGIFSSVVLGFCNGIISLALMTMISRCIENRQNR